MSRAAAQAQEATEDEVLDESEAENSFEEVDKLQEHGVNAADIKKLKEAGIHTIKGVLMHTKKHLLEIKGISEAKLSKILDACAKADNCLTFRTALQVHEARKTLLHITTGCEALDQCLGGGIESCSITEAFGEFRTGKTQLSHTLAVTAQLPQEDGGGNGRVLFIDTEGTFRPDRIISIAERFGVPSDTVLDNILMARAFTSEMQMSFLLQAGKMMVEHRFALIIVDSATALFRIDFQGRGELANRQQSLGKFLSSLMKLAEEFNLAAFITNQVQSTPDALAFGNAPKPIGGHVVGHACTTRLALKKGKGDLRICKIYDSPNLPEAECTYQLGAGGIQNAKD